MKAAHPFLLLLVFTPFLSSSALAETSAKILSMEGSIQVKDSASTEWKNAAQGAELRSGAEIRSGDASTCELGFLSGQKSAIRVQPNTLLTLDSAEPVRLNLREGRVFSLIRELKPGAAFTIKTPTAVAVARGTGGDHGTNDLAVHDGTFEVEASNGDTREFSEGEGVFLTEDGFGETFDAGDRPSASEWKEFQAEAGRELDQAAGAEKGVEADKPVDNPGDAFDAHAPSGGLGEMERVVEHETALPRDENTKTVFTDELIDRDRDFKTDDDDDGTGGGSGYNTGGGTAN